MADKNGKTPQVRTTPEIERFLAIWRKDPKSRVFAPLAEAYRKIGEVDRAIEVCLRGLEVHPNYVSGRVALGRAYFDKGDLGSAKAQLEMVYEADPENLVAAKTLGEIYEAEGNLEKAMLCYRLALYSTPSATEIAERLKAVELKLGGAKGVPEESKEEGEPSPLEKAMKELRKSEALAAGEVTDAESAEEREGEDDVKKEIERLRRVPTTLLAEKDELGEATDEFFAKAVLTSKDKRREKRERNKELVSQTLTELLLRRGYVQRAVKVYEEFLLSDPENEKARQRIAELKDQLAQIELEIQFRQSTPPQEESRSEEEIINSLEEWLKVLKQGAGA